MRKKDIKAWLRIVEAFIAILIIIGVVLVVLSKQGPGANISESVYEKQRQVLNIISKNNNLRVFVLAGNNSEINNTISDMVPASWNYATEICDLDSICNSAQTPNDKEVYTTEIVITSTLNAYNPKKLRFFVWMK